MTDHHTLLQAVNLNHAYGSYHVLESVNLQLFAGEIALIYGPNGSGKTTLLLCLAGLLRVTSGEVRVNGHTLYSDERAVRRDLAFVPDVPHFYTELTAWEHLLFIAAAHNALEGFNARAEKLLKEFGLWEARDLFPHHFSRGMSLKLGLVLALIRPFKILLLDEPTSALDTDSAQRFIDHLLSLQEKGAAILLSTHNADLFSKIANRVYTLENAHLKSG